jgi:hypothetical protein
MGAPAAVANQWRIPDHERPIPIVVQAHVRDARPVRG